MATNDADQAQILANHFETVFTRESSLPEVFPQSHIDAARIDYVQITCGDVKRILKSLKKDKSPGPDGISPIVFERTDRRDQLPPQQKFFRLPWNLDDCQMTG